MPKVTDRLTVWDEDPDSFDDFAAQCRWYRDGLRESEQKLARVERVFAGKNGKNLKPDPKAGQQVPPRTVLDWSICSGEFVKRYAVTQSLR